MVDRQTAVSSVTLQGLNFFLIIIVVTGLRIWSRFRAVALPCRAPVAPLLQLNATQRIPRSTGNACRRKGRQTSMRKHSRPALEFVTDVAC